MRKADIVKELSRFFKLQELVPQDVYEKYAEVAWDFLNEKWLHTLLVLRRDILKVPLVLNTWYFGGAQHQRGLRVNTCQISKDKTAKGIIDAGAHYQGMAGDLTSSKMSADDMRKTIIKEQKKLPYPIRLESGVSAPTWCHFDTRVGLNQKDKVYVFKG